MRKLIVIASLIGLWSCSPNSDFSNYRNNPFQYPYPEYHLKAEIVKPSLLKGSYEPISISVDSRQISFQIISNETSTVEEKYGNYYLHENSGLLGVLTIEKENLMGCTAEVKELEKDFCSAGVDQLFPVEHGHNLGLKPAHRAGGTVR